MATAIRQGNDFMLIMQLLKKETLPQKIRRIGLKALLGKLYRLLFFQLRKWRIFDPGKRQLQKILSAHAGKKIIYFPPYIGWHMTLHQRPQHIAKALAQQGYLYFFGSVENWQVVENFCQIDDSLFVSNRPDLLEKWLPAATIHLYSTNMIHDFPYCQRLQKHGHRILYEFVDEMDDAVATQKIPDRIWERHRYLITDPSTLVIATHPKLLDQLPLSQGKVSALIPNGVDVAHFQQTVDQSLVPQKLKDICSSYKMVIGYYGAWAQWVDWQLIHQLALQHPDYLFLFYGVDMDRSRINSKVTNTPNCLFWGPVPYDKLPHFASLFDVCSIPFVVNDVTLATSPLKLYEYLAMNKPVWTSALPECVAMAKKLPNQIFINAPLEGVQPLLHATPENVLEPYSWEHLSGQMAQLLANS